MPLYPHKPKTRQPLFPHKPLAIPKAPVAPEVGIPIPEALKPFTHEIQSAFEKMPDSLRKQIIKIEHKPDLERAAGLKGWYKENRILYLNPELLPKIHPGRTLENAILHEVGHLASESRAGLPFGQTDEWKKAQGWELKHGKGAARRETYWEPTIPSKVYNIMSPEEDFADAYAAYILFPESLKGKSPEAFDFMQTHFPEAAIPKAPASQGELIPLQYRGLVGLISEPLLPAIEPEEGERKIDAVLRQLKSGVENIQDSYQFRLFLTTMSKFHAYSIGNQILIMLQKPTATHVAGFNTWKDLGRWVKLGEKGIAILAPVMPSRPTCPKCGTKIPRGARFCPKCGEEVEVEGIEVSPVYFKVVSVFDISQTEGKPLPEFEVPVLTGEVNEVLFGKLLALMKVKGGTVSFESRPYMDSDIKGQYSPPAQIWVRPEEPRAQQLKTLCHEVAHYYSEGVFRIPRRDAETIAESSAFVVGAHYGFDTGVRSFPYVALWAKDKKVLEQNLGAIRKVATTILEALD